MITRAEIVAEARTWIGTPWKHQACLRGVGTDCIGLIGGVALGLGIQGAQEWAADPHLHCYGRSPDPKVLIAGCNRFMDRITVSDISVGDVLVMSFEEEPQHFALISAVNKTYIIHAYAQRRKVVENGLGVFGAKVLRAYRYRGINV